VPNRNNQRQANPASFLFSTAIILFAIAFQVAFCLPQQSGKRHVRLPEKEETPAK